ncbi:MAG: hypothetical protein U0172_09625 [Nitrospiraceae bacterium]
METTQALDTIGTLVMHLKGYAAKLPAVVHLAAVPGGVRPKFESIEVFEQTLSRFREQAGSSPFKRFTPLFTESLEAFEVGNVLGTIQPVLAVLDQIEQLNREKLVTVGTQDRARIAEYRTSLHKMLPGNQPELEGAGRGL